MRVRRYLSINRDQNVRVAKLLKRTDFAPASIHRAKKDFLAFLKSNPILHLECRLQFARTLTKSPASNKFWSEVMCGILDCPNEREKFRRDVMIGAKHLGGNAKRTVDLALAWREPKTGTTSKAVSIGWPVRKRDRPLVAAVPTTQQAILATFCNDVGVRA